MDSESVKRYVEGEDESPVIDSMPFKFIDALISHGLKIDVVEPGRILFSFNVPQRLVDSDDKLIGGAIVTLVDVTAAAVVLVGGAPMPGVSVDINVSYVDVAYVGDEVEIEAKVLSVKDAIGVVSVELRNKPTGKVIVQGRHSMLLVHREITEQGTHSKSLVRSKL